MTNKSVERGEVTIQNVKWRFPKSPRVFLLLYSWFSTLQPSSCAVHYNDDHLYDHHHHYNNNDHLHHHHHSWGVLASGGWSYSLHFEKFLRVKAGLYFFKGLVYEPKWRQTLSKEARDPEVLDASTRSKLLSWPMMFHLKGTWAWLQRGVDFSKRNI